MFLWILHWELWNASRCHLNVTSSGLSPQVGSEAQEVPDEMMPLQTSDLTPDFKAPNSSSEIVIFFFFLNNGILFPQMLS